MRIHYEDMKNELTRILLKKGFSEERAAQAAVLFADNSLDGVYSHGVNRFPRVVEYIDKGYIKPDTVPTLLGSLGAIEQWDGNLGMGNLNAKFCMNRAIELSADYSIGCVALRNTNHWMRGGAYGWQAANAGRIGICWTNTQPNMPAWGAVDRRIGNNPLVMAIPRKDGHVVVDAAMSQFSYGKIEEHKLKNKPLPVPGGFDTAGNVSTDPQEIEKTWRVLPIGFWKGAGLSIVFDLLAAVLSGGNSTAQIGRLGADEYAVSQVFIAIDPFKLNDADKTEQVMADTLEYIKGSMPAEEGENIRYPGEGTLMKRAENLQHGIPVDEAIWNKITGM